MNSLKTFQALNQVVNHDICPQMKALMKEVNKLKIRNKILTKKHKECKEWKDYFKGPEQLYYRCVICDDITNDGYEQKRGERPLICDPCFWDEQAGAIQELIDGYE